MRTYQKHVALSMISSLPRNSLLVPCQALSRDFRFPAVVQESARKALILLGPASGIEKISLLFPCQQGVTLASAARSQTCAFLDLGRLYRPGKRAAQLLGRLQCELDGDP